ncbi:hypothetical protein CARUB_v10012444mg, partial [Capsella rubella]
MVLYRSTRRNKQSSASTFLRETLPIDLIIEILSRLPVNSIARYRFVSKQWASLLQRQDFTELFLTRTPMPRRQRLLFTFRFGSKWHYFSSPQPQDFGDNVSVVATEYIMGYSGTRYKEICQSVNGFIYLNDKRFLSYIDVKNVPVICNPCTGQHITLPKVETGNADLKCYFGYDPIRKQFKVLCWTMFRQTTSNVKYQVLTLGTGELLWRKIECPIRHTPEIERNGICINGVLYYTSYRHGTSIRIVCFDVRSEKFSFVDMKYVSLLTLIDYKGKLGVVVRSLSYDNCAELEVLDDTKEGKWSIHNCNLPYSSLEDVRKSIWASDMGDIVWPSSTRLTDPLYVYYKNVETDHVRTVEIKGLKDKVSTSRDPHESLFFFTNYDENL